MSALDPSFLTRPLAHRGLHDIAAGAPENSRAAFAGAIAGGYGIECDVQFSSDGEAVVFHDDRLERLTGSKGRVREKTAAELAAMRLLGSGETIPTLAGVLDLVGGRAPLLIEIKDQDGVLGPGSDALAATCARALAGYGGPVALMSFNPLAMSAARRGGPRLALGLVTLDFQHGHAWGGLDEARRARLDRFADLAAFGGSFVSHDRADLASPHVARYRAAGGRVLCWTVRSPKEEAAARRHADNITFEGYRAQLRA